jgi:hypothetical protein
VLISHRVRTVLIVLGSARSAGHDPYPYPEVIKASSVLWGILQAHRVMREMLLDDFWEFPK